MRRLFNVVFLLSVFGTAGYAQTGEGLIGKPGSGTVDTLMFNDMMQAGLAAGDNCLAQNNIEGAKYQYRSVCDIADEYQLYNARSRNLVRIALYGISRACFCADDFRQQDESIKEFLSYNRSEYGECSG
ncbi:MAG: hypothetical protein NC115_05300 [Bacteroidales bacterium]|nr:hypothetical protein [Bacteroidales bacterium]